MSTLDATLIQLTQKLLDSIAGKDWATYQQLTDPTLTCFEPEACGNLVEGMPFHQFYFQLGGGSRPGHTSIVQPHVRVIGDVAIVCYVRLIQSVADTGPQTVAFEETRVWHQQNGQWKHVHFHRSACGKA
jgi:calcium/calmodulin-dependent protein kinase (CaM kinase) II